MIPFLILDGAWTVNNYQKYHKILPLTKTRFYSSTENTYLSHLNFFLQAYGGSVAIWEPDADIQFLVPRKDFKKNVKVVPPAYIYTSKFNYDSLIVMRSLIGDVRNETLDTAVRHREEATLTDMLDRYTASIQQEKPWLFYGYARVRFFKTYLLHSGTHNLFYKGSSELNKAELLAKVFYSFLYVFILACGFAGSFYLLWLGLKNVDYLLIGSLGIYAAFVIPFVVRMDQIRYFVPGYPFFVIATAFLLITIYEKVTKRQLA